MTFYILILGKKSDFFYMWVLHPVACINQYDIATFRNQNSIGVFTPCGIINGVNTPIEFWLRKVVISYNKSDVVSLYERISLLTLNPIITNK
jgi:hypothetical protein